MPWFTIQCNRRKSISREKYEELIQEWIWPLERFEYILEESATVWVTNNCLELTLCTTRMDSLEPTKFNKYVMPHFEKLIGKTNGRLTPALKEFKPRNKWITWQKASELYLYTDYISQWLPVKDGQTGTGIPIYLLPLDPSEAEQISFWAIRYREFDGVQLGCGELEIPAYKQMAEVKSGLSKSGREICKSIEEATGKPTYYFLHRYWGWENKEKEKNRKCPGCGKSWKVKTNSRLGMARFGFKCVGCRLVSEICSTTENKKHAEIGIYQPKKRPSR